MATAQMSSMDTTPRVSDTFRWWQLALGVVAMVMIANYQYGWTFFVPDIQKKFGWDTASIQIAFTLFVLFETWLVPIEGWFVDKYGPSIVIFVGGILCGIGWWMTSRATTLGGIDGYYSAMIICGIGAGGVYGTCIGNALKWFPDKRGLASGITAAGFGAGSALTVTPIQNMIQSEGFQNTFLYFGVGQGIIICLLAFLLKGPKTGQVPAATQNANVIQTRRQYAPSEIIGPGWMYLAGAAVALVGGLAMYFAGLGFWIPLALAALIFVAGGGIVISRGEPVFTLMYFMFVIVGAGGLIVTANLKPIAADLKVANIPVTLMGLTMTAITFAATIDRILNGLTRPFFGWVSDKIGRENTMFVAFLMEGIGIYLLYLWGANPVWFVLLSGFVFFAWGEIYSLFPSTCTDTFGSKFAATNAGLLYTAKGTAALLVPYSNYLQKSSGSWDSTFLLAAGANILAALLALFVLKPWRQRVIAASGASLDEAVAPVTDERRSARASAPSLSQSFVAQQPGAASVIDGVRAENIDLKRQLSTELFGGGSAQAKTPVDLEAENAVLRQWLALQRR
jgi:MFS transporter, OFA family, oxalate/formate antiporter